MQQRDSAVLANMMRPPGAPAAPQQPLGLQQQPLGLQQQPGLGAPRRDDAVLSSFMQSQPPGQVMQRHDDAVLTAFAQTAPVQTPQLGQATGLGRDDAALAQIMGGASAVPLHPAERQQWHDDTALEQLLGLNSPLAPRSQLQAPVVRTLEPQVQPQSRHVDFKTSPVDIHMGQLTPNALAAELSRSATLDDMARRPVPGSLRQRHGGSLTASAKRLSLQPRGRVAIPTPRKPRRMKVPPRQGHQRDILEERAKSSLEEENLDLRKHQNEMKKQLQQLEVKLRRAKSPGREGADLKQRTEAWADVEKLQQALTSAGGQKILRQGTTAVHRRPHTPPTPGGPRGQRQGSQRRLGSGAAVGRLRGRMTNLPWGQAIGVAPAPAAAAATAPAAATATAPGTHDSLAESRRSRSASPSPVLGYRPDPSIGPGATPPSSAFLKPDEPLYRPIPEPLFPSEVTPPTPPRVRSVSPLPELEPRPGRTPALPLGIDDPFALKLRHETEDLRAQKQSLSQKLDELLVSRITEEHSAGRFREKARIKDQQLRNAEKVLARERQKAQETDALLRADTGRLERDLAVARNDLHHSSALKGVVQDIRPLHERLKIIQDQNTLLTKQIRDLTLGAFGNAAGNRMVSQQRLDELTKQIEKKTQDCGKMVTDQQVVDAERTQAAQESAELEKECRALMEENERLTIRMEEKAEGVRRAQEQMTGVLENIDPEDKKVLLFSLQFLREREAAKSNQQLLDSVIQGVPRPMAGSTVTALGQGDLSVEETTHLVDSLRAEKDDLAQEVRAIQDICMRERGITKDLRSIHRMDMDEHALQIQVTMQDTERCKHLASEREKRIEELQKELVRRKRVAAAEQMQVAPTTDYELAADVVSEAGFSECSELEASNNALDIFLMDGRLEERALVEIPRLASGEEVPLETAIVTMVLVEFMNFDVVCSEEASGLRPHFESLISLGPFEVNDDVVEHFARGAVRFELQAFAVGATAAYTLGRASLPLAVMLDCTPKEPNPVVTGTLSFASETDVRLQIATVQFKARMRKTVLEALALFTTRRGTPAAITAAAVDGGGGMRAAAGLMNAVRTLIVQIISVEGLISYRPGVPPQALRPYVCYEGMPGQKQHSTDTMTGPSCRFEDTSSAVLRVDAEFCRWADKDAAEGGGLHFVVFDSSAPGLPASGPAPGTTPAEEQLGVLGEVWVPVGELLKSTSAQVQGTFSLRRGTGRDAQPAGIITVNIRWKDDASVVLAAPGVGGPSVMQADSRADGRLTEEQYQIMWQRVIRRLHVLKLPAMDWFYKHDIDQDGFWTKQETRNALSQMPIGLSPLEIEYIFDRMDMHRRGLIAPSDLGAALAEATKAAPLELWARDQYRRILEALARQGQLPEQAFCAAAQGWQAQKRDFFALVTSLDLGLKPDQLEWLWKLSDATSAGILDFREFANRLREAEGTGSTAFTLPRTGQEALQAPVAMALAGAAGAPQGPMSDTGFELCMFRILRACSEMGWRTIDKIMQELGAREDGAVTRANLVTFCLRSRGRLSDWEVEQIVARLDPDKNGAVDPRTIRTVLLHCDISDSQAQVAARRALACIGRMRQGLLKRPPPPSAVAAAAIPGVPNLGVALRALLEEMTEKKIPLVVQRQDFVSAAVQLGIDDGEWQLEELWAFVDKMRDGSLDIDSFIVKMAATPLPGEVSVDAMTDEHFAILMGRLKKALDRLNLGSAEKAFQQFRTGQDGCISPMELETALAQVVDNLSPHERKLLVGRIDSNKDGRISFVELETAMARASVSAISNWAQDVCQRITASLQREGRSIDTLFDGLAQGQVIHWPKFEQLFTKLEPSLSMRQLQHLWQAFDKNGDGGVSREEFTRAFVMVEQEGASQADALPAVSSSTDVLLSRIYRVLGVGPLSVKTALAVYDTTADGSLDWNQWRQAVLSLRLPLAEPEAIALHRALTRNSPSGRMLLSVLEAEVTRVALQTLPEERWARAFVPGCAQRAIEVGAPPLDQVLAAGNEEAVEEAVFLSALSRHHPVSEEQWVRLRPLLERRPEDGRVLWQHFLRWALVPLPTAGVPGASALEADVCARITESLRKQGTSIDELFNALAKNGIMHWPDYVTLFATLEPSLTVSELQHLWQSFDKNGDGGVSREEFRRGLVSQVPAPASVAAVPPTPSHTNVCSRIRASLRRAGTTADALFNSLAQGGTVIMWQSFITLFTEMEPTLTVPELERLWKSFDKDGDGGVTREEFERGLALDIVEQPDFGPAAAPTAPPTPAVSVRDVCIRVLDALKRDGKSVDDLFVALSKGAGVVHFKDFWEFFQSLEPSLTQQQLEFLWQSFDKDGDGTVSQEELLQGLVLPPVVEQPSAAPPAPSGVPTPSATDVCTRVLAALQRQGTTVDQLFTNLAQDGIVQFAAFYDLFQKIEPSLTREQLDGLWRSFDSNADGGVSLAEFQRGLRVPQPVVGIPAAGDSVIARIQGALQRAGKSADDLFDDIAKGGSLIVWETFATIFAQFEPSLTAQQLLQLWKCFDKNGDGGVSREEFRRGLGSPPQAPGAADLPASAAPGPVDAAPPSINTELVTKTIEAISAVVTMRGGDVRAQLKGFDPEGTGRLNRAAFREAVRFYAPFISEEALEPLWQHLGGPAADEVGIGIEPLAIRLTAPQGSGEASAMPGQSFVTTPAGASVSKDVLWAALRRVRSTLHARAWRPASAFEKLAPPGSKRLPREALNKGLTAIGCPLLETELHALFAAMSSATEEGATDKEFVAVFAIMGDGFDEYMRDLFSRVGTSLISRFGSLVNAFEKALDVTGEGVVKRASFRDAILRYGDMNLVEPQLDHCWQLAVSAGGGRTALDFQTFQRLFTQADLAPPQATSEFNLTLEEACSKFDQLGCTANLRKALARSGPEGVVNMTLLSTVVHAVAPELSDAEVEQVCRLAPRVGGPLSPNDDCNYYELLLRFESGQNDWHPIYPLTDRKAAADVCRYISQQVVASGFRSFADFVAQASRPNVVGKSLPAPTLCGHVQRWMPGPLSEEDKELTEVHLMRLGQILPSGGIDLEEFYARFEHLAHGKPVSVVADTGAGDTGAGVGLPGIPELTSTGKTGAPSESRVVSKGKVCPFSMRAVSAERLAQIAAEFAKEAPTGEIPFDKLHSILERSKVAVSMRHQRPLKEWLAPLGGACKWPMLFAFAVGVERVTVAADKLTRERYPFLQFEISFCGEVVMLPAFGWTFSLIDPKKMTRSLHDEARFNIDGPNRISQEDLAEALKPSPPPSHRIRITLHGTDSEKAGTYTYTLGVAELCLFGDVPAKDLRQGSPGSERIIHWELSGMGQVRGKPHLHATLSLTTRNAGRLLRGLA